MPQKTGSSGKIQKNADYAEERMRIYQNTIWIYAGSVSGLMLKNLVLKNICKMVLNDPLSSVLSHILNCEKAGKKECLVKPSSSIIKKVLQIMKDNKYIGDFKENSGRGGNININLLGKINKCGVIKPRLSVKKGQIEKYEKRYLPAKDFGIIILSTNKGLMIHNQAKEKGFGGRLISYVC